MVKNIPTIERSTKIRFGKNVPDSDVQAENTIVFNASNTLVTTPNSGSIYMSPVRFRQDIADSNIVLMMYNRLTGELSESGESANSLIGGVTLENAVNRGNTTSNTVQFINVDTSFLTYGNVGIANTSPIHTLDVGSNLYIDDAGSNVLVVTGNVSLDGNLTINGGLTTISTENLKVKDAIIELGANNTSGDTTLDLGLIMTRPDSNVTIGFQEGVGELVLAYTESSADSNTITPITSETLDVHVYGRVFTESNVGIINTSPIHTLDIGSNLYVDEYGSNILVVSGNTNVTGDLTVDTDTLRVDSTNNKVGIKTVLPDAELHVVGNTYVSSNLTVDVDTFHVDVEADHVGINTKFPDADLHVVGNVYASANLTVDVDTLHVDVEADHVGINTKNPDAELHVVGNVYASANLTVDVDTFHVDVEADHVGINTKNPDAELHVVGNVYASANLTVDVDTFHVDVEADHVGINTKFPDAELHVVGNTYVSSDLTVDTDTFHVDSTLESVGINTIVPDANLHVVGNVYASANLTVDVDTFHVDVEADHVGINTKNPDAELHVVGNAYVSSNLTVDTNTLHVDAENNKIGIKTVLPDAELHVVGNAYVSSDLTVDTDTFHVDATLESVGINTKTPTSNLHVVGNAYVTSNTTSDGTLTLNHPTTALITDLTSNVEVKLNQLANVVIGGKALANEDMLVYDGSNWTNQLQNHTFLYAKAEETIAKGDVVYTTGTIDNNMFVIRKAQANSSATMPALGVAYQGFGLNDEGLIVTFGQADDVNTDNFQTGETVYVSNVTAGALSNVKPYGPNDLIQNIGLVVKGDPSTGIVNVTGVGRSNDIPNAPIVADEGDINYVYVNDNNNDLKKILPTNLLTQLQTLQQVTDTGNTTSNTIQFTDVTTGLVTVSNVEVGSNISVAGLVDPIHKHVPMVALDGFLEKSPIYFTTGGKYVVAAAEAEFLGNLTLSGNTTILNSNSVTIEDRIFGVASNNSADGLDSGFMIEHQDDGVYANIAMIYHADDRRLSFGHTQNTFTDDHILHYQDPLGMIIDLRGNVQVQNSTTLSDTLDVTGAVTLADDLTVGAASNLFVDVSSSRVGINEASPTVSLDVGGDARVQSTTDTAATDAGALVVSGGLGVASNIHSTNVYAGTHVGVGTNAATAPLHLVVSGTGETTNGIYVKNTTGSALNDSIVNLEVAASGGDPFITWNQASGSAFAMGLDSSENLLAIANSKSDLTTNQLLHMTTTGVTTIENTTNSTSKTDGALIIGGGVGVTGDVYATNVNASANLTVDTNTLHVDSITSRVGVGTIEPTVQLDVVGTTNISADLVVDTDTLKVDSGNDRVGINNASPSVALDVTGSTAISGDLAVDTDTLKVDSGNDRVGINKASPSVALDVVGTTNISADLAVNTDTLKVDSGNNRVGINNASPSVDLDVTGSTAISGDLAVDTDTLKVDSGNDRVGINKASPSVALDVVGTTNISADLAVDTDTLKVDSGNDRVGVNTASPQAALHVTGNTYVSSNLNVGSNVFIVGGLVTNTGGVTKKTYSFSTNLSSGASVANATYVIDFTYHSFQAKVYAMLIESDDEISTLTFDVIGGKIGGASASAYDPQLGQVSVVSTSTMNTPWDPAVTTAKAGPSVTIKPANTCGGVVRFNIFVEYLSHEAGGQLTSINCSGTSSSSGTFGY